MSVTCAKPRGTNAAHCWHSTNQWLTSDPPQEVLRCCHCGAEHHRRVQRIFPVGHHGPYSPDSHAVAEPNT